MFRLFSLSFVYVQNKSAGCFASLFANTYNFCRSANAAAADAAERRAHGESQASSGDYDRLQVSNAYDLELLCKTTTLLSYPICADRATQPTLLLAFHTVTDMGTSAMRIHPLWKYIS